MSLDEIRSISIQMKAADEYISNIKRFKYGITILEYLLRYFIPGPKLVHGPIK